MNRGTDAHVVNLYKARAPERAPGLDLKTFGTIDCGYETMTQAWGQIRHVFAVGPARTSQAEHVHTSPRYPLTLLNSHGVDLLVVDRGSAGPPGPGTRGKPDRWEALVDRTNPKQRPKVVLESWNGAASSWSSGPMDKSRRVRW